MRRELMLLCTTRRRLEDTEADVGAREESTEALRFRREGADGE